MCARAQFSWVTNVRLHIKALAMGFRENLWYFLCARHFPAYTRVARFCRRNPQIAVGYVLESFSCATHAFGNYASGFINQGIVIQRTLRRADFSYLNPIEAECLIELADDLRGDKLIADWTAPNLKFFPAAFPETTFRKEARHIDFEESPDNRDSLENMVATAMDWQKNGI
ncbi:hypothetical protein NX059_007121 [Plenodomus lindquistii]|nr:hypothetical protein NX059_007121 [Plenodomus lindquistii]